MGTFYLIVTLILTGVANILADCPDPIAPEFGFQKVYNTGSTLGQGSKVRFVCNTGYDLVGSPVSVCKEDGQWSLPSPQCIPNCPELSAPTNGEIAGKSSKYGMVVKFSCDYGFTVVGASMATCKGGRWSHPTPECLANCQDPGFPENSERFTEGFDHGDSVRFSCDAGFNMIGSSTVTCQNGQWTHNAPLCVPE
ncbi:seizure 6-like protein 2 [Amphiura filiformis]|uniref:seizure 6-like protein 2 n=1 Tax=Amphiura filiformis TaxID=82378 RepID=UPI003B20EEB3